MALIDELKIEIQGQKGLVNRAKKQFIPTGEKIAQQAWEQVSFSGKKLTVDEINANFNEYLCELVDTEYQIYLEYEERCNKQGVLELALDPNSNQRAG